MIRGVKKMEHLEGVRLREHLMEVHGWTVAMVLAQRANENYLMTAHEKEHTTSS
jgi:hypothetical protein